MANDDWLERLHDLAYRIESLGVTRMTLRQ